jgi:oryzin
VTQENPPYGLAQISNLGFSSPSSGYHYDDSAGEGTFIYVVDSGMLLDHVDFEGRAEAGFMSEAAANSDRIHGTYVASIAAGSTYGVAKRANIIDVHVLGSTSGSLADVLSGLDWLTNDAISKGRVGRSVVNMSLSTRANQVMNDAVQATIDDGITVVVAAGNDGQDAAG